MSWSGQIAGTSRYDAFQLPTSKGSYYTNLFSAARTSLSEQKPPNGAPASRGVRREEAETKAARGHERREENQRNPRRHAVRGACISANHSQTRPKKISRPACEEKKSRSRRAVPVRSRADTRVGRTRVAVLSRAARSRSRPEPIRTRSRRWPCPPDPEPSAPALSAPLSADGDAAPARGPRRLVAYARRGPSRAARSIDGDPRNASSVRAKSPQLVASPPDARYEHRRFRCHQCQPRPARPLAAAPTIGTGTRRDVTVRSLSVPYPRVILPVRCVCGAGISSCIAPAGLARIILAPSSSSGGLVKPHSLLHVA